MNRTYQNLRFSPKINYLIFLSAAVLWCFLIILAPWLASEEHTFSSGLIYLFFSKICHQISERSFFIFGKQLAVCSRCTGLYLGFLLGAIFYPIIFSFTRAWTPSRKLFVLPLALISIDVSIRVLHIAENTFASRFSTGMLLGTTAALFVVPGILSFSLKSYNRSVKPGIQMSEGENYGGTSR